MLPLPVCVCVVLRPVKKSENSGIFLSEKIAKFMALIYSRMVSRVPLKSVSACV